MSINIEPYRKLSLFFFILVAVVLLAFYTSKKVRPYWYSPRDGHSLIIDKEDYASDAYSVIAKDLRIPWDIVFLPEGGMLISERIGDLVLYRGEIIKKIPIESSSHFGEGGLLGMALHPNFAYNRWLYIYNTIIKNTRTFNRVERYRFDNGELTEQTIIIDNIPGAMYHDGGCMAFGPDGYLYITTGDAGDDMLAQDLNSLAGKILRLRDDGSLPPDNPFGNTVYSYGHRNSQGLTWDSSQRLWSTEHGPSGFESGYDELNLIEKGQNYGWPIIRGMETAEGMKIPVLQSGRDQTWAPASALFWDGSIFFGGLRAETLYEAIIDENPIKLKEHFKGKFGRIRTVVLGPDGYLYLTTSNRDGRGFPKEGDDKIIKIDPTIFRH